jgi:hypothetical protein
MKQTAHKRFRSEQPLVEHAAERVAFGLAARDISDYAAALVPATTDRLARPGESITQARQLRRMALDVLTYAVLLERVQGRSWTQIAASLGESEEYTRGRWIPVEQEWQRDDKFAARRRDLEQSLLLPNREVPATEAAIRIPKWGESRAFSHVRD